MQKHQRQKHTCFDNARIESFNGVFKTEALYSKLGKNKVKSHQYPVKLLAEKLSGLFLTIIKIEKKTDLTICLQ